ncbi:MFS transporter, CP family, cyanate transporter [Paenibacillaceae bacterium GAS479]|nr:MFS transporter, CP family, cyanate transporter [Paenibacillaceae bacterium GAS479]
MNSLPRVTRSRREIWLTIAGILLIAANMRAAITSVGPLINQISSSYQLSSELSGLLTSMPLLAFAVMSLVAPRISERFGAERSLLYSLVLLIAGMLVRAIPGAPALFVGTALLGLAIAVSNVLLPSIIKRDFPTQIGLLTGSYSVTMSMFAAIASGAAVPLSSMPGWDWNLSLLVWVLLAVIALVAWLPRSLKAKPVGTLRAPGSLSSMFRSPLAWRITFFMGLQSMTFYVTIAWLPAILHERGFSAAAGGWMLSLMQLVSLPTSFFLPVWASRMRTQLPLVLASGITSLSAYAGLLWGSTDLSVLWIILLGLSQGATISLALTFFGLRTRNAAEAARLSGMAQSFGYLLAALGPVLLGTLHDSFNSWNPVLVVLLLVSLTVLLLGLGAGRNRYVSPAETISTDSSPRPVG